jgi:hypothetical protein
MNHRPFIALVMLTALAVFAPAAQAGMPVPYTLNDVAQLRIEAISFFLLVLLLSSGAIQFLWNSLRSSFTRLPRLSYPRAVALMCLWGLLFLIVLAMIAGGRELMTPGAWEKHGATYRLKGGGT